MKTDVTGIASKMIRSGLLTVAEAETARLHAGEQRLSFAAALVDLKLADYQALGRFLSQEMELPYVPLAEHPPAGLAVSMLSARAAARWRVFPVAFDPDINLLTLAVSDSSALVGMERVRRLFLLDHDVAFTVAAEPEIETALQKHCGVNFETLERPKQRFPDLARVREENRKLARPAPSEKGADEGLPYEEVSGALMRMATLAVDLFLEKEPDRLREIRSRVRYASLLASRLRMDRSASDRVTVAAWLSAFDSRPEMLRSVGGLCGLRDLLQEAGGAVEQQTPETQVLALARAYVDLRERNPAAAHDVTTVRGLLRNAWSSSPELQPMLETFLQVLADETFLDISPVSGGVLVVGDSVGRMAGLSLILRREDLRVETAESEAAAWTQIGRAPPDLIVAAAEALTGDGQSFCRRLRSDPVGSRLPLIILETEGGEAAGARHLRAGASDAMTRPVDAELLVAKIQKLLREKREPGTGVSGSLQDMGFADMMQVLCAGGRTAEVVLACQDREGRVYLQDGEVIHAASGGRSGENAFYELMRWKEGAFQTVRCASLPARTIHVSVMSLLMEGARRADEEPTQ